MQPAGAKTRITLKKVLFATDLSEAAEVGLPYAREIARLYGSKVYALHVRSRIAEWDKPQENAIASLDKRLGDLPHEVVVREGDVPQEVLREIAEKQIDLVVIGTHGRTGLGRALLGSVAEAVFRESPCPVLSIGPHLARDPTLPLEIKEILYATDLTPASDAAARYALSLAQENQARLTILNVQAPPKTGEGIESQQHAPTLLRLQQLVPEEAQLWCEPQFLVEQGDPPNKILEVAKARSAGLVVMGIHPQGTGAGDAWRPIAHRVVAGASCPVLTVRG